MILPHTKNYVKHAKQNKLTMAAVAAGRTDGWTDGSQELDAMVVLLFPNSNLPYLLVELDNLGKADIVVVVIHSFVNKRSINQQQKYQRVDISRN